MKFKLKYVLFFMYVVTCLYVNGNNNLFDHLQKYLEIEKTSVSIKQMSENRKKVQYEKNNQKYILYSSSSERYSFCTMRKTNYYSDATLKFENVISQEGAFPYEKWKEKELKSKLEKLDEEIQRKQNLNLGIKTLQDKKTQLISNYRKDKNVRHEGLIRNCRFEKPGYNLEELIAISHDVLISIFPTYTFEYESIGQHNFTWNSDQVVTVSKHKPAQILMSFRRVINNITLGSILIIGIDVTDGSLTSIATESEILYSQMDDLHLQARITKAEAFDIGLKHICSKGGSVEKSVRQWICEYFISDKDENEFLGKITKSKLREICDRVYFVDEKMIRLVYYFKNAPAAKVTGIAHSTFEKDRLIYTIPIQIKGASLVNRMERSIHLDALTGEIINETAFPMFKIDPYFLEAYGPVTKEDRLKNGVNVHDPKYNCISMEIQAILDCLNMKNKESKTDAKASRSREQ